MSSQIKHTSIRRWGWTETTEQFAGANLEINVIFTEPQGTLAALKAAGTLAAGLGACIRVVAPLAVPYAFPISQPPVSIGFSEHLLFDLAREAAQGPMEINVHCYLCRDRVKTVLRVLGAESIVVIGGRKRWWTTTESRLARTLQLKGHQVVFVGLK